MCSRQVSDQLCTAFSYIFGVRQMAELASALNYSSDAAKFTALTATLVADYNTAFCTSHSHPRTLSLSLSRSLIGKAFAKLVNPLGMKMQGKKSLAEEKEQIIRKV